MTSLYTYAVTLSETYDPQTNKIVEEAKVIVEPTTVLAADSRQVYMLASAAIPKEYLDAGQDMLNRIVVHVAGFGGQTNPLTTTQKAWQIQNG